MKIYITIHKMRRLITKLKIASLQIETGSHATNLM
jgi:hypothetical protein